MEFASRLLLMTSLLCFFILLKFQGQKVLSIVCQGSAQSPFLGNSWISLLLVSIIPCALVGSPGHGRTLASTNVFGNLKSFLKMGSFSTSISFCFPPPATQIEKQSPDAAPKLSLNLMAAQGLAALYPSSYRK